MNKLSNPWIWVRRFRHRCGYGVHSPFAFRFITDVIYQREPYYAYARLDRQLHWKQRFRCRKSLHLLFRIANNRQPGVVVVPEGRDLVRSYLQAGCQRSRLTGRFPEGTVDLCFLDTPCDELRRHIGQDTVLVMDHLRRHRQWFRSLPAVVTFDLWDMGVAFFDTQYAKQDYIVNF